MSLMFTIDTRTDEGEAHALPGLEARVDRTRQSALGGPVRRDRVLILDSRFRGNDAIDIESSISHRLRLDQVAEGLEMLRTKRGDR